MPNRIPQPPPALVDALRAKNAIAVVGAGLSRAAGGPSWKELLEGIAYEAEQTRPHRRGVVAESLKALWEGRPLLCASLLKSVLGGEFQRAAARQIEMEQRAPIDREAVEAALAGKTVDRLFGTGVETPRLMQPTRSHLILSQLPLRCIITTNYDCLLENSLPGGEVGVFSRSASRQVATSIQDHRRFILKLHGDVHNVNDIVLTREDYDDVLRDPTLVSSVKTLLHACKPLWLGYGHADPDLSLLLSETGKLGLSTGFALVRAGNDDLLDRLEIANIFPSQIDSHDDTESYLLRLAEISGTILSMTIVLRIPWPGVDQAKALAAPFVEELSQLAGERLRFGCASAGSIVLTVEGSARAMRLLGEKLRAGDRRLTEVLVRNNAVSFDGIPVNAPPYGAHEAAAERQATPSALATPPLRDGEALTMALLSADVVKHSALVKTFPKEDVKLLLKHVREILNRAVMSYSGQEFGWAGDGGVFAFWGDNVHTRATLAGQRALHEMALFNVDPLRNPLPVAVRIRVAANAGLVEFRTQTNTISSDVLNLAAHLQQRGTAPDAFAITDALFSRCHEQVRSAFRYTGRFEDEPIYTFSLVQQRRPAREHFEAIFEQLDEPVERLIDVLREVMGSSGSSRRAPFEAVRSGLDQVYSSLDELERMLQNMDENWAPAFFDYIRELIDRCLGREKRLWETLEELFLATGGSVASETLPAFLHVAGSQRATLIPRLTRLRKDISKHAAGGTPVPEQPQFMARVSALIDADEADREKALVELLPHQFELVGFLKDSPPPATARARQRDLLAARLWALADRLLLEEGSDQRSSQPRVSDILADAPGVGERFREVVRGLAAKPELDDGFETEAAARLGHWPESDREIFWRCLLIAHPEPRVRKLAARTASMESVWWTVAYKKVRVSTLLAVAARIANADDAGSMMVFFDWTRSRLEAAIEAATEMRQLGGVRTLLLLFFGCNPFVRTSYFARLDDLRRRFDDRLTTLGVHDNLLQTARERAEQVRSDLGDLGNSIVDPPKPILSLPAPIQRWLAQDRNYHHFFVTHADPRIAKEILRHIEPGNVQLMLAHAGINSAVLQWILKQNHLFGNRANVMAALKHPHCSMDFARQYLPRIARYPDQLKLLSRTAPNLEIRRQAADLVAKGRPG